MKQFEVTYLEDNGETKETSLRLPETLPADVGNEIIRKLQVNVSVSQGNPEIQDVDGENLVDALEYAVGEMMDFHDGPVTPRNLSSKDASRIGEFYVRQATGNEKKSTEN